MVIGNEGILIMGYVQIWKVCDFGGPEMKLSARFSGLYSIVLYV